MNPVLVVGLGNRWRGDDAVGPLVLDGLRACCVEVEYLESPGDSLTLINAWESREQVWLVDACCDTALDDGELITIDDALVDTDALRTLRHPTSSHVLDLQQAITMSLAMANAPQQLSVYAVVGSQFDPGSEPGPAILAAIPLLVTKLAQQITATRPLAE